ncbi:leucine-rich repeat domain-containing protein [Treponema vincentii]|uniref:Leucine-rich repeat domain-containing protein n=1 Tax=Treponema vincentii TaxID=69710 RepID=A0A6P1Y2E1_9SPIR|nr:leucine-rich repeat domain-containing protein [Treponema vincentii]QHX43499.1 leucine-rich repeat domain-containing protein [Treponema vincentii]
MKKIFVLVLTVLLVSVSACKNPFLKKMLVEEEKGKTVSQVPKHGVTFSVEGGHGTLKAQVDGKEINSGDSVEQGKSVVFTAEPALDYVVEQWTNGGTVIGEAGMDTSYTYTVTANADIKVKFQSLFVEGGASLILSPDRLDITVEVTTADNSPITVEGCTETELTSGTETVLHAKGRRVILKGKIIKLFCYYNQLTALNVQGLTALQVLDCGYNQLTALNVQGLTALQTLDCSDNLLTALNVQGLSALRRLFCGNNQLTALNVQGLSALRRLFCGYNQLTALNVQGLSALQELFCDVNQLTALNVQGLSALQELSCDVNQLTELNVQGLSALKKLSCRGNQLTALNVQGLSALQELNCHGNQLTALNVQGLTALRSLSCGGNQLTALNVQGLTALQGLYCYNNQLTILNVQGLTALGWLYCGNNQLTTLNVQGLTALRTLRCYNNKLTAQAFTKLFDDLPTRQDSDNGECILYTEESGVTEGNHKDFSTPPDLAAAFNNAKNNKKWKMYKWNGSWLGVEI